MITYKPLSLNDKMPFGKYKGITLSSLLEHDRGRDYLSWIVYNIKSFKITDKVLYKDLYDRGYRDKIGRRRYLDDDPDWDVGDFG